MYLNESRVNIIPELWIDSLYPMDMICGTWRGLNLIKKTWTITFNPNGTLYDSLLGIKESYKIDQKNKIICIDEDGMVRREMVILDMNYHKAIIESNHKDYISGELYRNYISLEKICKSFVL